jgi:hypothetical protein
MLEIAEAQPAPLLLDGDPVQAQLAHRRPELARKACWCRVDLGGEPWRDLGRAREAGDRVA